MDTSDRLAGTDDDAGGRGCREATGSRAATPPRRALRAGRVGEADDAVSAPAGPVATMVDELADTIGRARPVVWREEQPTEATPLVESLRHTPYREPNQLELTGADAEAGTAMELAVRTGELMLRCGAGARDVESCVIAVAAACGLDNLEVDITNQSLLVQCRTPAGTLMTVLRVVRSSSRDFARLVAVHQFVEDLAAGGIDLDEATAQAPPDPAAEAPVAAMVRVPGLRWARRVGRDAARRRLRPRSCSAWCRR